MTTPYDAALRVIGREVDALRTAIGAAGAAAAEAGARFSAAEHALLREKALGASALGLSSKAYFTRAAAENALLAQAHAEAEARLETLRAEARDRYGTLRAIEGAAERYRNAADAALAGAEQARADDIACARAAWRPRRACA